MKNRDLIFILVWGFIALAVGLLTADMGDGLATLLRCILVLPFVLLLSGYPISSFFFPRQSALPFWDRTLLSSAFSLALCYPAGFLNIFLIEGKSNIFHAHLPGLLLCILALSGVFVLLTLYRRSKLGGKDKRCGEVFPKRLKESLRKKSNQLLLGILLISLLLNFTALGRADIKSDDYSISFKAYDLVDGNTPARDAYLISMKAHPPLTIYISHAVMQTLDPTGFYNLDDWVPRAAFAFAGTLSVLGIFVLVRRLFSTQIALLAAMLFAVNNYIVWLSRIVLRESIMIFFLIVSLYAFYRFFESGRKRDMLLSGGLLGALLLVKFTAAFIAPVYLLMILLFKRELLKPCIIMFFIAGLVFSPVIAFNAGAYITTGYMDLTFGKLLGAQTYMGPMENYPGVPYDSSNIIILASNLFDIYSLPIMAMFIVAAAFSLTYLRKKDPRITMLWMMIAVLLLYFWRLGIRAYYAPFFTIHFVIFSALLFSELWKRGKEVRYAANAVLILLVIYSAAYSYTTNIADDYSFTQPSDAYEIGRSGSEFLTPELSFSQNSRFFTEAYGFKELQSYILSRVSSGDTLLLDDRMDLLAAEWYFEGKDWNLSYGEPFPQGRMAQQGVETLKLTEGYTLENGDYMILLSDENPLFEYKEYNDYEAAREWAESGTLVYTIEHLGAPYFYVYFRP